MTKARASADQIARHMKVQITGVDSVTTTPALGVGVVSPHPSMLDEVPYEYVSSSMDEVPIRVNLIVRYSFR